MARAEDPTLPCRRGLLCWTPSPWWTLTAEPVTMTQATTEPSNEAKHFSVLGAPQQSCGPES